MGFNLPIDSYDKLYVRNENIAAPTTFLDSSTENVKTITANGNAKQLPIKFNKSAGFFNGTTDGLAIPHSSDFNFGTGDLTIEGFFNFIDFATHTNILYTHFSGATGLYWSVTSATNIRIYVNSGSSSKDWTVSAMSTNTWYHIALRRTSGTWELFIDGASQGTYSNSANLDVTAVVSLGISEALGTPWSNMWVKEYRVSNTSRTITVPATQYTSDSNTKLLLHFDTPATSPIAPAIYFDGTGDYLELADNSAWDLVGDFTIEFWMKTESATAGTIISRSSAATWYIVIESTGYIRMLCNSGAIDINVNTPTGYVALNKWMHVAISRSGSNFRTFINGTLNRTVTDATVITAGSDVLTIAKAFSGSNYVGFLREIRISDNARYTADFTPSQTGFTVDSNTKLYIKGNEANGVTTFVDSETTPKTVTTNGDTKIKYTEDYRSCIFKDDGNTGHKPYPVGLAKVDFFAMSTGVGYFDGTNSYLSVPDNADWAMGSGDFTLEGYSRIVSGTQWGVITSTQDGSNFWEFSFVAAALRFQSSGGGVMDLSVTYTPPTNQWIHVFLSRSGNNFRFFINGTQVGSTQVSANSVTDATGVLTVGKHSSSGYYAGIMDNIRIAKGVARYTATFDPPYDPIFNGGGNFFLVF